MEWAPSLPTIMAGHFDAPAVISPSLPRSLLKNPGFVIPNEVCEVRNLSFVGILLEEGFLAALGMTAKRIFQQSARSPVVGSWDVGEFLHLDG